MHKTSEDARTPQDWAGMDGATAWHLIDRHADGWGEVGSMMQAWLDANRAPDAQPWKWATRERGGMWSATDTEAEALALAAEWNDAGFEAWVDPVFVGAAPVAHPQQSPAAVSPEQWAFLSEIDKRSNEREERRVKRNAELGLDQPVALPKVTLHLPDGDARQAKVWFTEWRADGELSVCIDVAPQQPAAEQVQSVPREWRSALRKLAFMARTSGGTAGPDDGLMYAVNEAEALLSLPYLNAPQQPAATVSEPLSDAEINEILMAEIDRDPGEGCAGRFARAIEAAHGITAAKGEV